MAGAGARSLRTFMRQRLADEAQLATAYSLESVLIELIFIVGPALVALFVAFLSAGAAVVFAAACGLVGTVLFLRSPVIAHWRVTQRAGASILGPLSVRGFVPLLAVILASASGFPPRGLLDALAAVVVLTTVISGIDYVGRFVQRAFARIPAS